MRRIALPLFTLLAWTTLTQPVLTQTTLAQPALAPRSTEADLIRSWYRDYLGRDVGPELTAWVELLRGGMSQTDVQATILGSDEFYYTKGRDPQTFVLRNAAGDHLERADHSRSPPLDRSAHRSSAATALPWRARSCSRQPVSRRRGSTQVVETSHRLAIGIAAARRYDRLRDRRHAARPAGELARPKRSTTPSSNCSASSRERVFRPDDALLALDSASRSSQALQTTLNNPPGTAPSAVEHRPPDRHDAERCPRLDPAAGRCRCPVRAYPAAAATTSSKLLEQITARQPRHRSR